MANRSRNIGVKFNSEGYSELIGRLQKTAKAFDQVLGKSQAAIVEADRAIQESESAGDFERFAEAQQQKAKAAQQATKVVVASYRELRIKSVAELEQMKRQAEAAYRALAQSGKASAKDLENAEFALQQRLTKLDREINLQATLEIDEAAGKKFGSGVSGQLEKFSRGFVKDLGDSFKEAGKGNVLGGLVGAFTSPFKLVGTGLLEGIGFSFAQRIGNGMVRKFEQRLETDLGAVGENIEEKVIGLAERVGNNFFSKLGFDEGLAGVRREVDQTADFVESAFVDVADNVADAIRGVLLGEFTEIPKQFKKMFLNIGGAGLKVATTPFRVRSQATSQQAAQQAMELGKQITVPDKEEIRQAKSIVLVTGGLTGQQGGVENSMLGKSFAEAAFPQSYVEVASNAFLNDFDTDVRNAFLEIFEKLGIRVPKEILEGFAAAGEANADQVVGRLAKMFELAVLKGFDPDAIMIAARGYAFKQAYPDKDLNIVGHSGGGWTVSSAIDYLNRMGVDARGIGQMTPFTGLFRTAPENFKSMVGTADQYYQGFFEAFPGLFRPPSTGQVFPDANYGHSLITFYEDPKIQEAMYSNLNMEPPEQAGELSRRSLAFYRTTRGEEDKNVEGSIRRMFGEDSPFGYFLNTANPLPVLDAIPAIQKKLQLALKSAKDAPQLKAQIKAYFDLLTTLQTEIEAYHATGGQVRPLESLRQAVQFFPDLQGLADREATPEALTRQQEILGDPNFEASLARFKFQAQGLRDRGNLIRSIQQMFGQQVEGYAFDSPEALQGLTDWFRKLAEPLDQVDVPAANELILFLEQLGSAISDFKAQGAAPEAIVDQASRLLNISPEELRSGSFAEPPLFIPPQLKALIHNPQYFEDFLAYNQRRVASKQTPLDPYRAAVVRTESGVEFTEMSGSAYAPYVYPRATEESSALEMALTPLAQTLQTLETAVDALKQKGEAASPVVEKLGGIIRGVGEAIGNLAEQSAIGRINRVLSEQPDPWMDDQPLLPGDAPSPAPLQNLRDLTPGQLGQVARRDTEVVIEGVQNAAKNFKAAVDTTIEAGRKAGQFIQGFAGQGQKSIQDLGEAALDVDFAEVQAELPGVTAELQEVARAVLYLREAFDDIRDIAPEVAALGDSLVAGLLNPVREAGDGLNDYRRRAEQTIAGLQETIKGFKSAGAGSQVSRLRSSKDKAIDEQALQDLRVALLTIEGINAKLAQAQLSIQEFQFDPELAKEVGQVRGQQGQLGRLRSNALAAVQEFIVPLKQAAEGGDQFAAGFIQALIQSIPRIEATAGRAGQQALLALKRELEIRSPSRKTKEAGENFVKGFVDGITGNIKGTGTAAARVARVAYEKLAEGAKRAAEEFAQSALPGLFGQARREAGDFFSELQAQFPVLGKFKGAIVDIATNLFALAGAFTIGDLIVNVGRASFQSALQAESLSNVLSFASGRDGAKVLKEIADRADDLGGSLTAASEGYKLIAGATQGTGLSNQSDAIFEGFASAAAARNINPEATNRLFVQVAQGLGKPKAELEELKILFEIIPGSQNTLARALGMTTQEMYRQQSAGNLLASEVYPKLAAQFLIESQAGLADSTNSVQASINRLTNQLERLKIAIGSRLLSAAKPVLDTITNLLKGLAENGQLVGQILTFVFITTVITGALSSLNLLGTALTFVIGVLGLAPASLLSVQTGLVGMGVSAKFASVAATVAGTALSALSAIAAKFIIPAALAGLGMLIASSWQSGSDEIKQSTASIIASADRTIRKYEELRRVAGAPIPTPQFEALDPIGRNIDKYLLNPLNQLGDIMRQVPGTAQLRGALKDVPIMGFFSQISPFVGGRLTTNADQDIQDITDRTQKAIARVREELATMPQSSAQAIGATIAQIKRLDQELLDLQSRRDVARIAGDDKAAKDLEKEIERANKARAEAMKAVAGDQGTLEARKKQLEDLQKYLEGLANFEGKEGLLSGLKLELADIARRLGTIRTATEQIGDSFKRVAAQVRQVDAALANSNYTLDQEQAIAMNRLLEQQAQGLLGTEAIQEQTLKIEQAFQRRRIDQLEAFVADYNQRIALLSAGEANAIQNYLGKPLDQAGPGDLERIKQQIDEDPTLIGNRANIKAALDARAKVLELQGQINQNQQQIQRNTIELQNNARQLNKQVEDYLFRLNQQFKETLLEISRLSSQLRFGALKNRLTASIQGGVDNVFTQLTNSFAGILDQLASLSDREAGDLRNRLGLESEQRTLAQEADELRRQFKGLGQEVAALRGLLNGPVGTPQAATATPGRTVPFQGIQVTSARDASGEPGLDYVVSGGQRGAQFGALAAGEVIGVISNQNWETNLESNPNGRRGYGNRVIVRTIDQVTGQAVDMLYAHLDKVFVQVGQQIPIGGVLGTQGRTGSTTGPHVSVDFFGPNSNRANPAALAMRDRLARELQGGAKNLNQRVDMGPFAPITPLPTERATAPSVGPRIPVGLKRLNDIGALLRRDAPGAFNAQSLDGRSRLAIALGIAGTEVSNWLGGALLPEQIYGGRGGAGNNMAGPFQFNLRYWRQEASSMQGQNQFLGQILSGQRPTPDSKQQRDFGKELSTLITGGKITSGKDLQAWLSRTLGYAGGGRNWQGLSDGWGRASGLADSLFEFLRGGSAPMPNSAPRGTSGNPGRFSPATVPAPTVENYLPTGNNFVPGAKPAPAAPKPAASTPQSPVAMPADPMPSVEAAQRRLLEAKRQQAEIEGQLTEQQREQAQLQIRQYNESTLKQVNDDLRTQSRQVTGLTEQFQDLSREYRLPSLDLSDEKDLESVRRRFRDFGQNLDDEIRNLSDKLEAGRRAFAAYAEVAAKLAQSTDPAAQAAAAALRTTSAQITAAIAQQQAQLDQYKKIRDALSGEQQKAEAFTRSQSQVRRQEESLRIEEMRTRLEAGFLEGRAQLAETAGFRFDAANLRERAALMQENIRLQQELLQINREYANQPGIAAELERLARAQSQVNIENIKTQFKGLGETLLEMGQSSFQDFLLSLEDVFSGVKTLGEAVAEVTRNFLRSIAQMAAQMASAAIFRWVGRLVGGLGGGGGGVGSGIGGFVASLFGGGAANFADGGTAGVKSSRPLPDAVRYEKSRANGRRVMLGVFQQGEEVLSNNGEAQGYRRLAQIFGRNPLQHLAANLADGGTIALEGRLLERVTPQPVNIQPLQMAGEPTRARGRDGGSVTIQNTYNVQGGNGLGKTPFQLAQEQAIMLERARSRT